VRYLALLALLGCGRIDFEPIATSGSIEAARGSIAVGDGFACVIRDRGEVWCWGENSARQLVLDDPLPRFTPQRIPGIPSSARMISAGDYHACVIVDNGDIWCWGDDGYLQLGAPPPIEGGVRIAPPPPMEGVSTPVKAQGLPSRAVDVACGGRTTCAVLENGEAWCWGNNNLGQLGRGFIDGSTGYLPERVPGLSGLAGISLDDDATCAHSRDGHIYCWGENGRGHVKDPGGSAEPSPVERPDITMASSVEIGGDHTCEISMDGVLKCWGSNDWGALGPGNDEGVTGPVMPLLDVAAVELAFVQTCAIQSSGQLWCWGRNTYGVLGVGDTAVRTSPAMVPIDDALAVSTGANATCALRANGDVQCWGFGGRGLVGDGRSAIATAHATGIDAMHLRAGAEHTCASNSSSVRCWGNNRDGQLGDGTTTSGISSLTLPNTVAQLALGLYHSCARLADGAVYCWGNNEDGEIGTGSTMSAVLSPVQVTLPEMAMNLVSGERTVCAHLSPSGNVWCWGANIDGMVGNGSASDALLPVQVATAVDELVAGDRHVCARSGSNVFCWGDNEQGQIGNDDPPNDVGMPNPSQPVVANATALSGGGDATCASTSLPGIVCWGYGPLGILGTTLDVNTTPAASSATFLYPRGRYIACDQFGACWGRNSLGQLGNGSLADSYMPTPIVGLPNTPLVSEFALGDHHTCAVSNGKAYCWGYNSNGELGPGALLTDAYSPATVAFP